MILDRRSFALTSLAALPQLFGRRPKPVPTAPGSLTELLEQSGAPALGYAVIDSSGVKALEVGGRRRSDAPQPVTRDDQWHIGSNTKAMTAALYGKLVEQGRAAWGGKVPALFPDFTVEPAWTNTSIEDLLAHRAGVSDKGLIDADWLDRARADKRPVAEQRTAFARQLLAKPPSGTPGNFEYANANYILAGAAIERIARTDWETAITAGLFTPLQMTSAGFGAPTGAQPWGHAVGATGAFIPMDPAGVADNPPIFGPAGRVHVSLADYAKFAGVFLNAGGGYLKPENLAHLVRPWGAVPDGYALGWQTYAERAWAAGPVLAHEGSNTLWHAVALIGPERPLAVLTVCNADAGQAASATLRLAVGLVQRFSAA
jgi:CubicO group peptidase (beta-lactamase class C family)